jgi:hypothetical protein
VLAGCHLSNTKPKSGDASGPYSKGWKSALRLPLIVASVTTPSWFASNQADQNGGAIFWNHARNTSLSLSGISFDSNIAAGGGAVDLFCRGDSLREVWARKEM